MANLKRRDSKRMVDPDHAAAAAFFTDRLISPRHSVRLSTDEEIASIPQESIQDHSPISSIKPRAIIPQIPAHFDYSLLASYLDQKPKHVNNALKPQHHFFWSEKSGAIRARYFDEFNLGTVMGNTQLLLESGPFWMNFYEPTEDEMEEISTAFALHPLTNEDILTPDTREKCEVFPNYYFVVIRSFENDIFSQNYLQPIPVFIVMFRECVISFQFGKNNHPRNVLIRIDQLLSYGLHVSPDWVNYALIDDVIDGFIPNLKRIELEVDAIEDLVLVIKQSDQYDMIQRIGKIRKQVNILLKLMSTKADVIRAVINRCIDQLAPEKETRLYLEDIADHVLTMVGNLSHYEETLSRTHSNYLAQISIELTQASNRTSDVVLKMTVLASILVPLNVVTGLWGMNVKVPGQDEDGLYWFYMIIAGMALISILNWLILRQSKLL